MEILSEMILADLPAILCLIVGFILVVIEMYIPGFGAPGVIGGILLIAGIALRANNAMEALVMTLVIVALLCVALSIALHSASRGKFARSKLILHEVAVPEKETQGRGEVDLEGYIGRVGVARTVLRPAGIGEFEGVRLNVVSDGEYIERDAPIRVERVEGNRVVVKETQSA